MNKNFFVGLNLEVSKVEKLDELVSSRAISRLELVMVVMEPLILFEVDETSLGLDSTFEAPQSVLVNEQVHLSICCGVHGVCHENSGDYIVVPLFADEVHLQLGVEGKVTSEVTHRVV